MEGATVDARPERVGRVPHGAEGTWRVRVPGAGSECQPAGESGWRLARTPGPLYRKGDFEPKNNTPAAPQAIHIGGRRKDPTARSSSRATPSSSGSSKGRPTSCTPMGKPAELFANGTLSAGGPATLATSA